MNAIDYRFIEEARKENEDIDHPDALSVEEYQDLLDEVQEAAERDLESWVDEAHDQEELIGETDEAYYLVDHSGHAWNMTMSQIDVEDESGVVRDVLMLAHRKQAEADGYGGISVHVIAKPAE